MENIYLSLKLRHKNSVRDFQSEMEKCDRGFDMTVGNYQQLKYDVAVIGGGMAGISAALAVARMGASTH